jgi:hypothetical protein
MVHASLMKEAFRRKVRFVRQSLPTTYAGVVSDTASSGAPLFESREGTEDPSSAVGLGQKICDVNRVATSLRKAVRTGDR